MTSRRGQRGATSVEYVVLTAFVAGVIIVALVLLGNQLRGGFSDFSQGLAALGLTSNGS